MLRKALCHWMAESKKLIPSATLVCRHQLLERPGEKGERILISLKKMHVCRQSFCVINNFMSLSQNVNFNPAFDKL